MAEEDLPPPYSLIDEQPQSPTLQPSLRSRPSASHGRSRPASVLEPGFLCPLRWANPSSNVSLSASPDAVLDLSAFPVVTRNVKRQLVTHEEVKTHLRLLRAFRLFKEKVEDPYSDPEVAGIVPPVGRGIGVKGRWLWFLEMAVERFRRWVLLLATIEGFFVVPPVDVWLIWHTYMLNPVWYMEDCERLLVLRPLKKLKEHPLELVASMGDNIFDHQPNSNQEGVWEAGTQLPFNPFISSATLVDLDLECPRCELQVKTSLVNAEETGFAQVDFATVCPHCDALITRETLGIAKFIRDVILDPDDTLHVQMHGKGVYLPGSLLLSSGTFEVSSAARVKASIKYLKVFKNDNTAIASKLPSRGIDVWKKAIGERLQYSAAELRKHLENAAGVNDRTIRRILGAYVDAKPFSVELVAAAMRQLSFVDKIHQFGWLDPVFFADAGSTQVLQHCILRYYGFLTLIGTDPDNKSSFVPTLDVDLVWHTHQLAPESYLEDCRKIASRLIDHDDQVEEGNLAVGLDKTSNAWRSQFGVPYMYCGCPLKEVTVGQRLARARSGILSSRHRMEPPMSRDDCYAATHPSDHNSVFVLGRSAWKREFRQAEWGRRREKEAEKVWKGKRSGKDTETEERYLRGRDHEFAFSLPVSKVYGYGCPHVQQGYISACAVGVSGCIGRSERP